MKFGKLKMGEFFFSSFFFFRAYSPTTLESSSCRWICHGRLYLIFSVENSGVLSPRFFLLSSGHIKKESSWLGAIHEPRVIKMKFNVTISGGEESTFFHVAGNESLE